MSVPTAAPTPTAWDPAGAIRHHYDVGNDFYALWLDPTLSYSCALRTGPDDTLEVAQENKLRHHLEAAHAAGARRLLDVGCGWGAALYRATARYGVERAVGLTLSDEQATWVGAQGWDGVEVRTENWTEHAPDEPYDGIVSVGAFEHFARPDQSAAERLGVYRDFLGRCRDWSTPDGTLSLQTIVYGAMDRADASTFIQQQIFPAAELPTPAEIVTACEGLYEVHAVTNGRLDYAWTCEQWAARLRARREEATALVGADTTAQWERYLKMSALGFRLGKIGLLRLVLRPWSSRRFGR